MRILGVMAVFLALVACDANVDAPPVAIAPSPAVSAVGAPKVPLFEPKPEYTGGGVFAPFSGMRRWMKNAAEQAPVAEDAPPNPLRDSGLDAMRYVGYLQRDGQRVALLNVAGQVFAVRVGQRVGVEGARVRRIGEQALAFDLPWNGRGAEALVLPQLRLSKEDRHANDPK